MSRYLTCIILLLLPGLVHGGDISLRLFTKSAPSTFIFTPSTGTFTISCNGHGNVTVMAGEPVVISRYDSKIVFKTLNDVSILTDTLRIIPANAENVFTVRQPAGKEQPKTLKGSLKVFPFPGSLMILNIVDIETYLPGVVKAEAGSKGPAEYFRTQAVIARTYVYRHLKRHQLDGFDMCDDVHCQVYSGIITEKIILDACLSTKDMVITDVNNSLIISAFHANCGGQTASSGDVWVTSEPYLVSMHDNYCVDERPVVWERKIPVADWKNFLASRGITYKPDTISIPSSGIPTRKYDYIVNGTMIPAIDIRDRFRLKSTFFVIKISGESIIIKGKGYGHGVGLCQDGARVMASRGMTFREITKFYFPGTSVTNIKNASLPERP